MAPTDKAIMGTSYKDHWKGQPYVFSSRLRLFFRFNTTISIFRNVEYSFNRELYGIVLYLQPMLNPKTYDGARVLEASGRPMLVIGRSYVIGSI